MKYLKEFIIGSSFPVVALFYYRVYNYYPDKNYSYYHYTLAAPLWFGIWSIISLIIAEKYKLSDRMRYFVVSLLSLFASYIIFITQDFYDSKEEMKYYYLQQFIKYMLVWNIIIYNISRYI
jgi:hypothetical protein